MSVDTASGAARDHFAYTYTDNGDVHSAHRSGRLSYEWSFDYDAKSRLTDWTDDALSIPNGQWVLDAHSNRTSSLERSAPAATTQSLTYSSDTVTNRFDVVGGAPISYDSAGRMTRMGPRTFTYNLMGLPDSGPDRRSLGYAVTKPGLDGTELSSVGGTFLLGDHRYYSSSATRRVLVPLTSTVVAQLTEHSGASDVVVEFIHANGIGSSAMVVNGTGGAKAAVSYAPFGVAFEEFGNWDAESSLGFHGGETLFENSGVIPFGPRIYDARLGRFASPDALDGTAGKNTWNRYEYGRSNPLSFGDASGLCADAPGVHCGGAYRDDGGLGTGFSRRGTWVAASSRSSARIGGAGYDQPGARAAAQAASGAEQDEREGKELPGLVFGTNGIEIDFESLHESTKGGAILGEWSIFAGTLPFSWGSGAANGGKGVVARLWNWVLGRGGSVSKAPVPHIGASSRYGASAFNAAKAGVPNCVSAVCAFLNSVRTGQLHRASATVVVNDGRISTALEQISKATGARFGRPQFNTLDRVGPGY
ncbi:MAG: RHS repeat-associated core domain-containing protein, partial [Myxococcota bacterium]